MTTAAYMEKLLSRYAGTFDIHRPYLIDGKEYPAYGYFFSRTEKYVLVREANMWTQECFEHFLIIEANAVDTACVKEAKSLIQSYMEPILVRKGEAYPPKNHMYSYLTVILLSEKPLSKEAEKLVKRYSYDVGYKFHMRGFAQGRIAAVSMENEKVITNYAGRKNKKLFQTTFRL